MTKHFRGNDKGKEFVDLRNKINRRQFVKTIGGTAIAAFGFPYILKASANEVVPSERITLGFIGVGKQGVGLLWSFLQLPICRVVAVCDVDKQKLKRAIDLVSENYGENNGCAGYADFRELLARSDIDAVVIAVPEHGHAIIAIEACKNGKDVYCEKPLTLTIAEGRQVVEAARRYGRIFQTGTMQRSDMKFRRACELVRNGYIGQVKSVSLCLNTAGFPLYPLPCDLPEEPVPEYLDWDTWLGPVQWRPYNSRLAPSMDDKAWPHWRDYDEFAGGLMTDWGAHHFDIAQWGLGMDSSGPTEIYPEDGKDIKTLTYKYANGVTVVRDDTMTTKSILFKGTEGEVEVSREFLKVKPESLARQRIGVNDIHLIESKNHYANWLDCVGTRELPICDVETGLRSLTVCHLGIIAKKLGRPLKWDPVKERFVGDSEADRLLSREARSPWKLA
jgi:predicted dehydrogenase